jgi:hypothetical protein
MSSSRRFPRLPPAPRIAPRVVAGLLGVGCVVAALGAPRAARADENLLHGPHPFLKENDLSAHVLIADGLGDSMSGAKLALDYGYRLHGGLVPFGLDLSINMQHATCVSRQPFGDCGPGTGTVFETLAGVRWKFATPIPLVPYAAAAGGLVFSFPNGADDAAGLMARAVGGANYFFFDWLGLGAQVGFSVGKLDYDSTFPGSHTYAVFDLGGGLEFQF